MLGEAEWRRHAELIGRVALAWNANVHRLLKIFCFLTGMTSPLADAIFFASKSDAQQRQLIKRVAEVTLVDPAAIRSLAALLDRLGKLAGGRNSAVHVIFGVSLFDPATSVWSPTVVPALTDPPQDTKLQADFKAQFEAAERNLVASREALDQWLVNTPRDLYPHRAPEIDWSGDAAARVSTNTL